MKIKHSTWFAAGPEIGRALTLLSDGAFKLYMFLCLEANRSSGSLSISHAKVAKALSKSRRSVITYFDELRTQNVCVVAVSKNQYESNEVKICEEFWPYEKPKTARASIELASYLHRIELFLAARECVRCSFSGADQRLATSLFNQRVPVDHIERAITLGSCRKYASWLNGANPEPIVSLKYFSDLLEEASEEDTPLGYWEYLTSRLNKLESRWVTQRAEQRNGGDYKNE